MVNLLWYSYFIVNFFIQKIVLNNLIFYYWLFLNNLIISIYNSRLKCDNECYQQKLYKCWLLRIINGKTIRMRLAIGRIVQNNFYYLLLFTNSYMRRSHRETCFIIGLNNPIVKTFTLIASYFEVVSPWDGLIQDGSFIISIVVLII